jgi:hypothetical protein
MERRGNPAPIFPPPHQWNSFYQILGRWASLPRRLCGAVQCNSIRWSQMTESFLPTQRGQQPKKIKGTWWMRCWNMSCFFKYKHITHPSHFHGSAIWTDCLGIVAYQASTQGYGESIELTRKELWTHWQSILFSTYKSQRLHNDCPVPHPQPSCLNRNWACRGCTFLLCGEHLW